MHNGSVRRGSFHPLPPYACTLTSSESASLLVVSFLNNLHRKEGERKVNGKRILEGAQGLSEFKGVHVHTQHMGIVT